MDAWLPSVGSALLSGLATIAGLVILHTIASTIHALLHSYFEGWAYGLLNFATNTLLATQLQRRDGADGKPYAKQFYKEFVEIIEETHVVEKKLWKGGFGAVCAAISLNFQIPRWRDNLLVGLFLLACTPAAIISPPPLPADHVPPALDYSTPRLKQKSKEQFPANKFHLALQPAVTDEITATQLVPLSTIHAVLNPADASTYELSTESRYAQLLRRLAIRNARPIGSADGSAYRNAEKFRHARLLTLVGNAKAIGNYEETFGYAQHLVWSLDGSARKNAENFRHARLLTQAVDLENYEEMSRYAQSRVWFVPRSMHTSLSFEERRDAPRLTRAVNLDATAIAGSDMLRRAGLWRVLDGSSALDSHRNEEMFSPALLRVAARALDTSSYTNDEVLRHAWRLVGPLDLAFSSYANHKMNRSVVLARLLDGETTTTLSSIDHRKRGVSLCMPLPTSAGLILLSACEHRDDEAFTAVSLHHSYQSEPNPTSSNDATRGVNLSKGLLSALGSTISVASMLLLLAAYLRIVTQRLQKGKISRRHQAARSVLVWKDNDSLVVMGHNSAYDPITDRVDLRVKVAPQDRRNDGLFKLFEVSRFDAEFHELIRGSRIHKRPTAGDLLVERFNVPHECYDRLFRLLESEPRYSEFDEAQRMGCRKALVFISSWFWSDFEIALKRAALMRKAVRACFDLASRNQPSLSKLLAMSNVNEIYRHHTWKTVVIPDFVTRIPMFAGLTDRIERDPFAAVLRPFWGHHELDYLYDDPISSRCIRSKVDKEFGAFAETNLLRGKDVARGTAPQRVRHALQTLCRGSGALRHGSIRAHADPLGSDWRLHAETDLWDRRGQNPCAALPSAMPLARSQVTGRYSDKILRSTMSAARDAQSLLAASLTTALVTVIATIQDLAAIPFAKIMERYGRPGSARCGQRSEIHQLRPWQFSTPNCLIACGGAL